VDRLVTILYDGWSLIRESNSPEALHLLAILAHLPAAVQPVLALPAIPPAWLRGFSTCVQPAPGTAQGRLNWEQRLLPRIAREQDASLIHFQTLTSPLFGRCMAVVSPSDMEGNERSGERSFARRLLDSTREGGLTRAQAVFWPDGLPAPGLRGQPLARRLVRLPQVVHPAFQAGANGSQEQERSLQALNLPETFILYHGPGQAEQLDRLLNAWSWAAGAIGEYYPLLALGLDERASRQLADLADGNGLHDSVRALPEVAPDLVPALYFGCTALFHPAPVFAWGGAVQHAMASGRPVVGAEGEIMNALVGPAAYLAPVEDSRALGAALLTVIVEEPVAEQLAVAARQRVNSWGSARFGERLLEAYLGLLAGA
jgi:hypothetical protein